MGWIDQIQEKRFGPAKKDLTEDSPTGGFKRFWFVFSQNFWRLMGLNLLFLFFCVPVVTIPAAVCGLNRVLIALTREGYTSLWGDFIKEFKANLLRSLPFGLFAAFLLADSCYALYFYPDAGDFGIFLLSVGLFLFIINAVFSSYVFVFLPSLNLKNRHIMKNALVLMMFEWKTDLILVGINAVTAFLAFALFPFSLVLLLFIWLLQLAVCVCVNEPMQRRIIGPYEESA